MYRTIILLTLLCCNYAYAQRIRNLEGRVLDATTRKPIAGATVLAERKAPGEAADSATQIHPHHPESLTDENGRFILPVSEDIGYFTISFLGYQKLRVAVYTGSRDLLLQPSGESVEEVIVTGYTDIKKRKNTTAYKTLAMDDIRQAGVSSLEQMLQGQVAGMQFTNVSGGPNGISQIRIRGTVSITGTQDPLWVVDGLPVEGTEIPNRLDKDNINDLRNLPIANLNPDDIQDITVLKDAAATSIYGARAANGVIVITTKRGKSGPAQLTMSANSFVSERPDYSRLNLMDAAQKVDFELALAARSDLNYRSGKGAISRLLTASDEWDAYRNGGLPALSAPTRESILSLRTQNHNWGNTLFRQALNQQYSASISGGTAGHMYYISGGFYDERGNTYNTGMKRYNLTATDDFRVNSRFKGGLTLLASATNRQNPVQDADAFSNPLYYARTANPYLQVRDAHGDFIYDPDIEGYGGGDIYVPFNAIEERENTRYRLANKSLKAITYLQYDLWRTLSVRTELGLQVDEIGTERFRDEQSYGTRKLHQSTRYYDAASSSYNYFLPQGGTIENTHDSGFQYNWKSFLTYSTTLASRHELELMSGTELRRTNNTLISTKGFGFNPVTLTTQTILFPNSNELNNPNFRPYAKSIGETSYASFYANGTYTLDKKYNVYGSIRYDGSNMFGVDPRYRFLPIWSLSGSWLASEEEFVKRIPVISYLRVRASYGTQGNIDRNTYPFIIGSYNNATLLPGTNETTIVVNTPANDKLRWERTQSWNAGFDLGLWRDRLHVTADYYNRQSSDVIGISQLPLETGFENVSRNWAGIRNEGVELTISSLNTENDRFSWSTDFNIAHNRNTLTRVLANPRAYTLDNRQGYPVNSLFVLQTAGLDADGVMQFTGEDGNPMAFESYYGLYDPWADFLPGYLVANDLTPASYRAKFRYAGNQDPSFIGGITNRFRLDGFDFAISAAFNLNKWVRRSPGYNPARVDRGANQPTELFSALQGTRLPAIGSDSMELNDRWMAYSWLNGNDPANSYNYYDIWAKQMSYIRINSMRLGYTLPAKAGKRIGANLIRCYVEARNPFVFGTDYTGFFDPETYGDLYAQPITRSFTFGVSARF